MMNDQSKVRETLREKVLSIQEEQKESVDRITQNLVDQLSADDSFTSQNSVSSKNIVIL
jgi:parvulin-like peptidyl-prolyl isomerase